MFASRKYTVILTGCVLAMTTLLSGCQTTTAGGAVGAQRSQLMLVSSEQLEQMSAKGYAQMKSQAIQQNALNTDRAMWQRINGIANRIKPQTAVFRRDALNWNWEVNVIQDDQLNAFCMPGGKIVFYSGLINNLRLTDNEIAVVMGHEIAHALREHSREQVSQALAAQTAIGIGGALLGLGSGATSLAGAGYQALIATRFSRTDETEADRIGLELAARAGYDPRAGLTLWQKMGAANNGASPPEFLSSHPAGATRSQEIQSLLPIVMPLYEAARGSN